MNKTTKSSYLVRVLVFVVALVILGVSTTYAYFTLNIKGDATQSNVTAGKLVVNSNLDTVAAINNSKLPLINATDKNSKAPKVEFYIENKSTSGIKINYNIYLTDISISKNLCSPYFKWELLKNNTVVNSGDFSTLSSVNKTTSGNIYTIEKFLLNKANETFTLNNNAKDTLIFRLWLENADTDQTSLTNGSFSAKLFYEAVPVK